MGETGYDQIASVGTRYSDTSGFVDLQEVTIFDEDGNIENELRYLYNYSAAMSSGGADALHL